MRKQKIEMNPPKGSRADFVKVTITLPPALYQAIAHEASRRKSVKEKNPLISSIIREAVSEYLKV